MENTVVKQVIAALHYGAGWIGLAFIFALIAGYCYDLGNHYGLTGTFIAFTVISLLGCVATSDQNDFMPRN